MANLRMQELVVENFRSISGRCIIPLDGSITLIHGANGAGKTSLLSAIELAATGQVGFLEEQKGDVRSLLRNHDYPLGSVRLSLADFHNATREGSFELDGDLVSGSPALTESERTYFLERSFLPQTALGRLLDSYTDTGKDVDTALVRFVKSLVGLDDLDALIAGLHPSGDRRRSRRLVPAWGRADDDLAAARTRRSEVATRLDRAEAQLAKSCGTLRELIGDPEVKEVAELLKAVTERQGTAQKSRDEIARYEELQAMVDAITRLKRQDSFGSPSTGATLDPSVVSGSRVAFETWETKVGRQTLDDLNRIREAHLGLRPTTIDHLTDSYREALEHATAADHEYRSRTAAEQEHVARIGALDRTIQGLDHRIEVVQAQVRNIEVSPDVRILIEILELTIPLVDSERCPVCDQAFDGDGPLQHHLAAKLDSLSTGASQLLLAERELKRLIEERLANVQDVVLQKSLPLAGVGPAMDSVIRSLNGLGTAVDEGQRLRQALEMTQSSLAEESARAAQRAIVRERVAEVAGLLEISADKLDPIAPETTLGREIAEHLQRVRYAEIRRRRELDASAAVVAAQRDLDLQLRELETVGERISAIEAQVSSAESRMTASRTVLQVAERTRSKLINEVFDQSLNTLWAQLFGRFAPSERFTPRFVKQKESSRSVDVSLETELPNGQTSGSPGAMLSYGNTNSAALALFMALHLSAPSELPWLIFDDPVQSMDDIHIANFAAIARQLAFAHQRQIVIAIHQPELFDYLSLALAPSDPTHSLVRVTLDRGSGSTSAVVDRVSHSVEPQLRHAT